MENHFGTLNLKILSFSDPAARAVVQPGFLSRCSPCQEISGSLPDYVVQFPCLSFASNMASFRKRLGAVSSASLPDRTHFFAVPAQLMRRILVDAARARGSVKHGGLARRVANSTAFNPDEVAGVGRSAERIALDHALDALAKVDPRKTRVIELRFFGGLSPRRLRMSWVSRHKASCGTAISQGRDWRAR